MTPFVASLFLTTSLTPAGGGGGPVNPNPNVKRQTEPSTPKRYWRIVVTGHFSNGAYIAEIEFRNTPGGPDLTTPAMTVISDFGFNPPANAFDNNNGSPTFGGVGNYIGIDFGAGNPQVVKEATVRNAGSGQTFVHGRMESSNDNITWVHEWQLSRATISDDNAVANVFRWDDIPNGLFADFRVNADPPVEGYTGTAFTKTGSPGLDTTTKLFDPSPGNVLNLSQPAGWAQIGTGDWTMEIHMQNAAGGSQSLNAPGIQFFFFDNKFRIFQGGGEVFSTTNDVLDNTFAHYAVVRKNNQMFFYKNGVSLPCSQGLFTLQTSWSLLGGESSGSRIFAGQFGRWLQWRFARYTGDFTPPAITDPPLYEPAPAGTSVAKYTYAYTGAEQNLVVPAGVTAMKVKLWGAGGQGGQYSGGVYGGGGGYTEAEFNVTPGQTITVQTGQGGIPGQFAVASARAYPDGSAGSFGDTAGGGGGGSSRVWIDQVLAAVAGAGGGAAGFVGHGGSGGGLTGGDGANGGSGGTQTASQVVGAPAGLFNYNNTGCGEGGGNARNGALAALAWANRTCQRGGFGGAQGVSTGDDGGGGGGGWYGGSGGGGDGRSGGGGSSYIKSDKLSGLTANGEFNASVNSTDPDFPGGTVAKGTISNSGVAGGHGFVVVDFLNGPTPISPTFQNLSMVTTGTAPNSSISKLGKRWTSGPNAGADWHKAGIRESRKAADGDFYYEVVITERIAGTTIAIGVADSNTAVSSASGFGNNAGETSGRIQYFESGQKRENGNYSALGATFGQGDAIGIRLSPNGAGSIVRAYKNGVLQGTLATYATQTQLVEPHFCNYGNGASKVVMDILDVQYLPAGSTKWVST